MNKLIIYLALILAPIYVNADDKVEDMSDPLAVFTQLGFGFTNKGLNLKMGQAYDTGSPKTLAQNIIELKGIGGDALGWDDNENARNNSVDFFRLRNFKVTTASGSGSQIDVGYDFNNESGSASYSFLKSLPKMGRLNIYPLAGVGVSFANNAPQDDGTIASGYSFPGTFALVGMFAKFTVTDKIWINYNPNWVSSLSGSDLFKDKGFEGNSNVLKHELALSYQINPRSNIRYFGNWSENIDFADGDQRIEYNKQF